MKMGIPSQRSTARLKGLVYHEAGHAVACVVLHRRIAWVRIDLESCSTGIVRCTQHPILDVRPRSTRVIARRNVVREVVIAWSGLVAEKMACARINLGDAKSDAEMIVHLLKRIEPTKGKRDQLGRELRWRAIQLLEETWDAVDVIARELAETGSMTGRQCKIAVELARKRTMLR